MFKILEMLFLHGKMFWDNDVVKYNSLIEFSTAKFLLSLYSIFRKHFHNNPMLCFPL